MSLWGRAARPSALAASLILAAGCYGSLTRDPALVRVPISESTSPGPYIRLGELDLARAGRHTFALERLPNGKWYLGLLFPPAKEKDASHWGLDALDIQFFVTSTKGTVLWDEHLTGRRIVLPRSESLCRSFVTETPSNWVLICDPKPMIDPRSTDGGIVYYPDDWKGGPRRNPCYEGIPDLGFTSTGRSKFAFRCEVLSPTAGGPLLVTLLLSRDPHFLEPVPD